MPSINSFIVAFVYGALIILPTGLALPTPDANLAKRVDKNEQSCKMKSKGVYLSTNVRIGVPYDSGSRCHAIFKKLADDCTVTNFRCTDGGDDSTTLKFDNVYNSAGCLNPRLHKVFPEVNNFNCPDY